MALVITFTGEPGNPSISTGGPLELIADLTAAYRAINDGFDILGVTFDLDGVVDASSVSIWTKTELASVVDGSSGADKIGSTALENNSGSTIQSQMEALDSAVGERAYTENNYIVNDQALAVSVNALDMQVKNNTDDVADKADDDNVVHKTGLEIIYGIKAFGESPQVPIADGNSAAINKWETQELIAAAVVGVIPDPEYSELRYFGENISLYGTEDGIAKLTVEGATYVNEIVNGDVADDIAITASGYIGILDDGTMVESSTFSESEQVFHIQEFLTYLSYFKSTDASAGFIGNEIMLAFDDGTFQTATYDEDIDYKSHCVGIDAEKSGRANIKIKTTYIDTITRDYQMFMLLNIASNGYTSAYSSYGEIFSQGYIDGYSSVVNPIVTSESFDSTSLTSYKKYYCTLRGGRLANDSAYIDEAGAAKLYKRNEVMTISGAVISSYDTSNTNYDILVINRSSVTNARAWDSSSGWSSIKVSGFKGVEEPLTDSTNSEYLCYTDSTTLNLTVPKGTYTNVADAQSSFSAEMIYELVGSAYETIDIQSEGVLVAYPGASYGSTYNMFSNSDTFSPSIRLISPLNFIAKAEATKEAEKENMVKTDKLLAATSGETITDTSNVFTIDQKGYPNVTYPLTLNDGVAKTFSHINTESMEFVISATLVITVTTASAITYPASWSFITVPSMGSGETWYITATSIDNGVTFNAIATQVE